jgi:hypothetical protein
MARIYKSISLFLCFAFAALLAGCNSGSGGSSSSNTTGAGAVMGNVQGSTSAGRIVLQGATVTAVPSNSSSTSFTSLTDANGDYLLSNLPAGTYRLGFSANGYLPIAPNSGAAVLVTVTGGNMATAAAVLLQPSTGIGVTGEQGGNGTNVPDGYSSVVVTVTEAFTNQPITDATVSAGGVTTSQGSGGIYSLLIQLTNGTNPQAATLTVQSPTHDSKSVPITLISARAIAVTVQLAKSSGTGNGGGSGTGNGNTASVQVTVADAATGKPVSGATISDGTRTATGNSFGVATLSVSAVTTSLQLTASAPGYVSQTVSVNVSAGQTTTTTVRLHPDTVTLTGVMQVKGGGTSGLSTVSITVGGLSATFTNPQIDSSTGNFSLTLPANAQGRSVTYTLTFTSPRFNLALVNGVKPPSSGTFALEKPVILTPIGGGTGNGGGNGGGTGNGGGNGGGTGNGGGSALSATVFGTVLTFGGNVPLAGTATILELGVAAPVQAGRFGFTSVPVGRPLTLSVQVRAPLGDLQAAILHFIVPNVGAAAYALPTVFTR